ncbi:hypothetical protein F5141DRAFT_1066894 [Pisolithus sp. B1]|nr:hypothetical protein F5141DRAFT_1066894 [Pisolithus sp. B1]
MSCPTTHAKNASQHPGHIVLEGKQNSIQEEESQLTNPPKLKPRLCLIIKDLSQDSADMTKSVFGDDDRMESNMTDLQGGGEQLANGGEELDNELEGSLNEMAQKQKCTQKALIADRHSMDSQKQKPDSSQYKVFPSLSILTTMILLTETILFYWDCIDSSLEADKSKYSGVGDVVNWANKLTSSKPLHTLLSQCSASNSRYAWLVTSTGTGSQIKAITDVISGSELDKSMPSPPPPSQYTCSQWGHSSSDAWKALRDDDDNYVELSGDKIDDGGILLTDTNTSTAPPSKRTKTQHVSSGQGSQCSGSGVNKKFINSNLPLGVMNDNTWQHLFISALTYFTAGYNNPWTIPDDKLQHILQEIWDTMYWDKVMHMVVIGGPVYSLAKQGLSNWHTRFAAATIVVITTFFAHDVDFDDSTLCMKFADAMLKKNWFLFSQNRGTDNKMWTGLWQVPFILQTFAHHFNFIQGHADVSALYNDCYGLHTALALASAAVYGADLVMSLFSGHMSFKMTQPGNVWTAVIPKGGQFEFGEAVWGMMTRHYLEPIKELSDEQFGLIVEDTQKFMKKVTAPTFCKLCKRLNV